MQPTKKPVSNRIEIFTLHWTQDVQIVLLDPGLILDLSQLTSAQREGFFNIRSGWVLDKILGSGSGSGRVRVSKNTIPYFRVSFFLSGISGYVGYFRVFLGLPIYTRVIF